MGVLEEELKRCVLYFEENTNYMDNSLGYGLCRDKYPLSSDIASISSTGYSLAALVISCEFGWLDSKTAYNRALKSLKTIYDLNNVNGFYYHYLNYNNGNRELNSEISIIDTALLLCGVICVGEYFKKEIKEYSIKILERVNWQWFLDTKCNMFYLGYKSHFYGHWDNYAEQLIIYILSAGSKNYPVMKDVYYKFDRNIKDGVIYSWFGSLFTYQYSHAWINFNGLKDDNGIDWYKNSKLATELNKDYCLSLNQQTFKLGYWGLSSTITNKRYSQRLGGEPSMCKIKSDGTISISSLASSIIFDDSVEELLENLKEDYPLSFGKYGFITSVNLKRNVWYCSEYLGIDKGNTMLMICNHLNKLIWNLMMKNECVKNGLNVLNIK